jgi:hypothetical protein
MGTPWLMAISDTKTLKVFPDKSVTADAVWLRVFRNAIQQFNALKLGLTLIEEPNDPPDPVTLAGASAQFAAAAGTFTAKARGKEKTESLAGTELHGRTLHFLDPMIAKAFIFVPATPLIAGGGSRQVGEGVKLYIAVHELIHACGLNDKDHSPEAVPDVFCSEPTASMSVIQGKTDADDRMRVGNPRPDGKNVFPPITVSGRTRAEIQKLWNP